MSYKLEFKQSPNYTPGSQTQAAYGQPRSIKFGAGHWWNTPEAGARHDGIIATFMNKARQASAHAVLSDARVTEMVRDGDTSWATNTANPYTYSIEVDPRIMWKWDRTGADQALGQRIFDTLCEYIADKGYHNLTWRPHKFWKSTQCNPIPWDQVMVGAKASYAAKHAPAPSVPEWKRNLKSIDPVTLYIVRDGAPLRNLAKPSQVIKTFAKATPIEIVAETKVGDWVYQLSRYAFESGSGQGFDAYELAPAPTTPEWIKNLKEIEPVKLMVLPAQTPIVNLVDNSVVKQLGQGTWIDFVKSTSVGGKEFLISSYSATNAIPNGILKSDVGVPVPTPEPEPEKPEWLKNWKDVADVTMYTRADTDLVNLLDGSTIKTIPRGTAVEIASATEWHGQPYMITKYSTDKQEARGIRVDDLDMKPVEVDPPVVPTDPEKTTDDLVKENNSLLKQILALLQKLVDKLIGKS